MSLSRRSVVTGAGIAALSSVRVAAQSTSESKYRAFVLVHGAFHGGWCWSRVAQRLVAAGHVVYAPSLTGLADRSHLMSAQINLDTHISDIVNLFRWNDITDAVLVGHSYAGLVISGAIEKLLPQVSSIVYLDAIMPENGQRGADLYSERSKQDLFTALNKGQASRPPPPVSTFKIKNQKDAEWVESKLTEQPVGVSLQPVVQTGARDRVAKKTYIRNIDYPMVSFDNAVKALAEKPEWKVYQIADSGHDTMIDRPDRLVEILLERA